MTLSRLGGRMLRLRRLVRDHFAYNLALGLSVVYLRTVYWRNEAMHVKHCIIFYVLVHLHSILIITYEPVRERPLINNA